jgi:hypothetical protein
MQIRSILTENQLTIFFPENTWSNDTTVSYYCHWMCPFQKYIQQSCMLSKRAAVTKNRKFIKVVKILHGELECKMLHDNI